MPTIDDATTCVVDVGAPASDEPKTTAAEDAWLARPRPAECGRSARPTVWMIRHPPNAVPAVRAPAHSSFVHVGAASVSIRPSASSSAAITPIAFCASLAPWLNASAADIAHSPARTGPRQRRVARRATRRTVRVAARAASPPTSGLTASAINVPPTPTGCRPSSPPQFTASRPPANRLAPTSPPTSAWPELDGSPRRHVTRFQATAAAIPAPITSVASEGVTVTMPPMVSATAAPSSRGPRTLNTDARMIACRGVAARVATRAAIALDASCNPFVTANAAVSASATASPTSTGLPRR